MARYIFITGGVVSSLGKGLASAALGALLQARGYKVRLRKLDPYLYLDPGTMSPYQHGEVFVIEIGLGAVVGHEHFAMLVRRHRSGVEIEIGIELAEPNLVAPRLQQRAQRCRSQTFAERRNHAAGDEDVPRHGTQPLRLWSRFAKTNRTPQRTFRLAVGDVKLKTISGR